MVARHDTSFLRACSQSLARFSDVVHARCARRSSSRGLAEEEPSRRMAASGDRRALLRRRLINASFYALSCGGFDDQRLFQHSWCAARPTHVYSSVLAIRFQRYARVRACREIRATTEEAAATAQTRTAAAQTRSRVPPHVLFARVRRARALTATTVATRALSLTTFIVCKVAPVISGSFHDRHSGHPYM